MARKKEPAKIGRPAVVIDLVQLEKLGALQPTVEEVAAFFSVSKRTMIEKLKNDDLREIFERGKNLGKLNLRRTQIRHSQGQGSGAVNMSIHLGRQWLGQTDKAALELSGPKGGPIETKDVSPRELITSRIARIADRQRAIGGAGGADGQSA